MIRAKNLTVGYDSKIVLQNLNFCIGAGEFVAVVGPNGCGKSTLLKVLSANLKPLNGRVILYSKDLQKFKSKELGLSLSFLPQVLKTIPHFTIEELVTFGRYPYLGWNKSMNKDDYEKIDEAIELLDLNDLRSRNLTTLSGGERQRARIAMNIAQDSNILLLDEPSTYLDISHQYKILEILTEYNNTRGKTILMVLHDLNQAARFSKRVMILDEKSIVADGEPSSVFTKQNLASIFNIDVDIIQNELNKIILNPLRSLRCV